MQDIASLINCLNANYLSLGLWCNSRTEHEPLTKFEHLASHFRGYFGIFIPDYSLALHSRTNTSIIYYFSTLTICHMQQRLKNLCFNKGGCASSPDTAVNFDCILGDYEAIIVNFIHSLTHQIIHFTISKRFCLLLCILYKWKI